MITLIVLPNIYLCPLGLLLTAVGDTSLCDLMLNEGINVPHLCGKACVCSSCIINIKQGAEAIRIATNSEKALLVTNRSDSRLSCQSYLGKVC
ncbi:2Fe-2S iron-sulfur cluster-binding protein [Candidatus Tremblaya phenacola]|uniref:2Fe-2S ferredoxin n=1 Tax=Candidatus Tremblayella phenacoccinincola TaxID=1010676 RepID=A0A2G0V734_9PROT|nr:2Fe-2S iron-sulfur cluster-binding protein [Candidatus Tremblaya phenacola]PHN16286.1 2Fe-2S ferredoxin [Candidatus Tremblaya phenacola]